MSRLEPILSPGEVQALLDVAQSSGISGLSMQAEPVNLLSEDRYLRSLIPTLRVGYARLAESLRRVLTSVLRSKVELQDEAPEVLTGRGLVSVSENSACLIVVKIVSPDHDGAYGVIALDQTFAFAVIERLFGGGGNEPAIPSERPPTALERNMLVRALEPMFEALNQTLEPRNYFRFEACRVEGRLDLVPGFTPDITVMHVPFTMTIRESLASFSIATPASILEPLRGRVGVPKADPRVAHLMPKVVKDVGVRVSVELGRTELTLRQLLALRPGQVLTLDRHRNEELPVVLEGVPKFNGVPVQDDGAIGIEITGKYL